MADDRQRPTALALILDAAEEVMAEVGPARLDLARVAQRAGFDARTVHREVGDRDRLTRALVADRIAELAPRLRAAAAAQAGTSVAVGLAGFVRAALALLEARRRFARIGLEHPGLPASDADGSPLLAELRVAVGIVLSGGTGGIADPDQIRRDARAVIATLRDAIVDALRDGRPLIDEADAVTARALDELRRASR